MISLAASSYFRRTSASLVVAYLVILPLGAGGVVCWIALENQGSLRLMLTVTLLPAICGLICITLFRDTAARLLHPPDVGSEGKEVVDLEVEAQRPWAW